jgi:hypothetical protein
LSSTAEPATTADFVRRCLELVRRDCPPAWERVRHEMGDRRLAMEVDGEAFDVDVSGPEPVVLPRLGAIDAPPARTILLAAGRHTLLELVDGERTLLEAAMAESVRLRAATRDLAAFDGAMRAFLAGALRSAACVDLLARYRAWASERAPGRRRMKVIQVG